MSKYFIIIIIISILLLISINVESACTNLTQTPEFDVTCADVVDYEYYVSATPDVLNANATAALNLYNSALPTTCGLNYKKTICGQYYQKCLNGLPKQVCKSVCDSNGASCLGAVPLDITGLDCSDSSKFDQLNSGTCNSMTALTDVGSSKEPYLGGVCNGIVDTHVFIPTSADFNTATGSNVAPMLQSYIIQTAIESKLSTGIDSLPVWLGKECHFAVKKYLCSSKFMNPYTTSMRDTLTAGEEAIIAGYSSGALVPLIDNPIYIPSFPHQDVCLDYVDKCGEFIALANSSTLNPISNCDTSLPPYNPTASQVVKQTTYPGFASFDVHSAGFSTNPRYFISPASIFTTALNISDEDYECKCPYGFDLPDNSTDSDNRFFPGSSDCALTCRYFILFLYYFLLLIYL
jgi:hypothetical protein